MMKKFGLLFKLFVIVVIFINIQQISYAKIVSIENLYNEKSISDNQKILDLSDDFYFIQITDPHIIHKFFDKSEKYIGKLKSVLNHINSFKNKPVFIVITGDLVSIGGGIIGTLNYKAFLDCFYKKDDQLYADEECKIPVYTIPGNHDYLLHINLFNYHRFIDKTHTIRYNLMGLLENRQLSDRYIINYENLTLFFLDTGHAYIIKPAEWLHFRGSGLSYWFDIEWLESVFMNCSSKHKIALMHHPAVNWNEYDTIARNKEIFIQLCEGYDIDLVLAGHTHASRVFDKNKNFYQSDFLPLNCSNYPTLYVQTDACKEGSFYRNITISGNDVWLNQCEQII